jgi:hypothetical protein
MDLPHPEELVFTTDERVHTLVREAEDKFDALVADHELHVPPFLPLLICFSSADAYTPGPAL